MKITRETKFEIGQEVFVIFGNYVTSAKIKSAEISRYNCVEYNCSGSFIRANTCYVNYNFSENDIYATKQEAIVELKKDKELRIIRKMGDLKREVCDISRNYKQYDTDREELKEFIRLCSSCNQKLLQIIKKEHGNRKLTGLKK